MTNSQSCSDDSTDEVRDFRTLFADWVAISSEDGSRECQLVRDACRRHQQDLKRQGQADFPFKFDDDLADRACLFIEHLTLSTGEWAGKPFVLQPFQLFIVRSVFGWVHVETYHRRFRQVYISMARGNGKSPLAAAMLLYVFCMDYPVEARAQCYCVATKRDQAKIVFDECERFIRLSSFLMPITAMRSNRLYIQRTGSTITPLGSDSKFLDGLIPHGIVVDEMHAMAEHKHREMLDKLMTSMQKRRQPLLIYTTTAGDERSLVWRETYRLCQQTVSRDTPVEVDSLFVYCAEIDEEDDPLDEACWHKANPMLDQGVIKLEVLKQERDKVELNPSGRVPFIRYFCNRYAVSFDKPITAQIWARGSGAIDDDMAGEECRAGFDWGWKDDLAALALVFPRDHVEIAGQFKRRYIVKVWTWCPKHGKRVLSREPWVGWIRAGHLRVTTGDMTDTETIYQTILELREKYWIRSIAIDPNNCRELGNKLTAQHGVDVYEFQQSVKKYHEPTQEFLQALAEGRIRHEDNPLLAWCAANMILDRDHAGYCMPSKKFSEDKIDPIVATVMGLSEVMFNAQQIRRSYYDTHTVESM